MSDAEDAARWRKMRNLMRVERESREHWDLVSETKGRRVSQKVTEWTWQVDLHPDHSWKFYGSTTDEAKVPKTVDEILDRIDEPSGDEER